MLLLDFNALSLHCAFNARDRLQWPGPDGGPSCSIHKTFVRRAYGANAGIAKSLAAKLS